MALTREDFVTQSVDRYLREVLFERHSYDPAMIELLAAFPHDRFDGPIDKNYVAVGFNFDDGGHQGEMGSNLKHRLYTIEFFIIGKSNTWAKNLAHAVKFALESDGTIPLVDVTQPSKPVIDALVVASVSAEHQPISQPEPWQENIWTCHLRVEDTYDAGAAIS
jgi:hypothetical protein